MTEDWPAITVYILEWPFWQAKMVCDNGWTFHGNGMGPDEAVAMLELIVVEHYKDD